MMPFPSGSNNIMNTYVAWDQPSSLMIFSGLAINTDGSPGRRPTISCWIGCPVACSQAAALRARLRRFPNLSCMHAPSPAQVFQQPVMCLSKIRSMDVVSHTASIPSWIVISINQDLGLAADGHLEYKRNQVTFAAAIFTKVAIRIGTGSVEVSQQCVT